MVASGVCARRRGEGRLRHYQGPQRGRGRSRSPCRQRPLHPHPVRRDHGQALPCRPLAGHTSNERQRRVDAAGLGNGRRSTRDRVRAESVGAAPQRQVPQKAPGVDRVGRGNSGVGGGPRLWSRGRRANPQRRRLGRGGKLLRLLLPPRLFRFLRLLLLLPLSIFLLLRLGVPPLQIPQERDRVHIWLLFLFHRRRCLHCLGGALVEWNFVERNVLLLLSRTAAHPAFLVLVLLRLSFLAHLLAYLV
mmetsp:Transcript_51996/g.156040  ORF Transcript_51996/g.156040 Transcript_51996/m.156040 type:complete len:247 (-) Transcript_51996:975-1715(-)